MDTISISQLKIHPSKVISKAEDFPVAVEKRNQVKGYIIGKELYDKLIAFIEDYIDNKAVKETNYRRGRNFDEVAEDLGI